MSQENKKQHDEEDTCSIVSSNIGSDFIKIGQSANEQEEQHVDVGQINPQPLPLPVTGTTGKSHSECHLELQIEALKAKNQQEKMINMELEQKNARLQETMRRWQLNQDVLNEITEGMFNLQEQHQKEMRELEGKVAEFSKKFQEKLEIQEKLHKKEIVDMKKLFLTQCQSDSKDG